MASTGKDTIDTPLGPLPRDPAQYRPSDHFRYRFSRREDPPITGEVVETCIRGGEITEARGFRRYRFEATLPYRDRDVRWWLIVGLTETGPPYTVITAYAPDEHPREETDPAPL